MSEWQPIETAPKDGTHILVLRPSDQGWPPYCRYMVSFWEEDLSYANGNAEYDECDIKGGWFDHESEHDHPEGPRQCRADDNAPTHWMPLPQPPVST